MTATTKRTLALITAADMTHQQLADYLELIDHDMFNNDLPYYAEAIKRLREYYEPDPPRDYEPDQPRDCEYV